MNLREFFTTNIWWGKILGGFFGYLSGGSVGAIFGILVGNFFDRAMSKLYSDPHWQFHAEKQKNIQKVFFESTFSVMGYIAKADGRVSEKEVEMARMLMNEMRLNSEQKALAKRLFNDGKLATFRLDTVLDLLQRTCRNNRELLKMFVDIQYRAAQVDGLSATKIKVLDTIFSYLGFAPLHQQYRFYEAFNEAFSEQARQSYRQHSSSSNQRQTQQAPHSTLPHAYALLEIEPTANKQEVKRAYRRLISKNHPDKLIAQGLPQEMIKIANDKTQKIVKAYEIICASKGW